MKKRILLVFALLLWVTQAWAVPVLQLGVVDSTSTTGYVPYTSSGEDKDTAFTTGNTLVVAGLFDNNVNNPSDTDLVVGLGGQYVDPLNSTIIGQDWSAVTVGNSTTSFPSAFDGHGAILIATVSSTETGTLLVNGVGSINTTASTSSYFPTSHYPVKEDGSVYFFFFDIGDFTDGLVDIPDFATGVAGNKTGEIKTVSIEITGYNWVHFDVVALETRATTTEGEFETIIVTSVVDTDDVNSVNSHDVTWTYDDDNGQEQEIDPVPEPGTIVLLGCGLVGLAFLRRKQK